MENEQEGGAMLIEINMQEVDAVVAKCWPTFVADVEHEGGVYSVALTPLASQNPVPIDVSDEEFTGESRLSLADALEDLASKIPPDRSLPWQPTTEVRDGTVWFHFTAANGDRFQVGTRHADSEWPTVMGPVSGRSHDEPAAKARIAAQTWAAKN